MEGTPTGTYLYTVNYKDENIFNTFTLSVVYNNGVEEYIYFDVASKFQFNRYVTQCV